MDTARTLTNLRCLVASFFLLALTSVAGAQSLTVLNAPPLSGTSLGNGVDFTSSQQLFVPPGTMTAAVSPFSISYSLKTNITSGSAVFVDNTPHTLGSGGWSAQFRNNNDTFDLVFNLQSGTGSCLNGGRVCSRGTSVSDGVNWHHVCISFGNGPTFQMVDGFLSDRNPAVGTYTVNTAQGAVGPAGSPISLPAVAIRQVMIFAGRALRTGDCEYIALLHAIGLAPDPSDPILASNLYAWWPMNDCTPSGCPDHSGNGRDLVYDTAPTVAITTPAPSAVLSGTSVSFTATCTDPIACTSVTWKVDGVTVGSATTAPYTFAWNSTTFIDGPHTITALALNAGNNPASASISVTTNNGITAQSYFVATAGSDSNNCKTSGTACATVTKICTTYKLHGGDSILYHAGDTFTNVNTGCGGAALSLIGPNAGLSVAQWVFPGGSGAPITLSTYGGGTCNVMPGGTQTGCATLDLSANATITVALQLANLDNVNVSNLILKGGGAGALGGGGIGLVVRNNNGSHSGINISNTKVLDWTFGINPQQQATSQTLSCNITNSFATGSTPTSGASAGILITGLGNQCNVTSSLATNIGCTADCVNGGIISTNGAGPLTIKWSLATAIGANARSCGGPYGIWMFEAHSVVITQNEVYNVMPTGAGAGAGCDMGGYDIDGGSINSTITKNYSHDNYGPCLVGFTASGAGLQWTNNTFSYNICDHETLAGADGTGSIVGAGGGTPGSIFIYGNIIWDTLAGMINPVTGLRVRRGVFGFAACPTQPSLVANNIFAAITNNVGVAQVYGTFANINCVSTVTYRNNDWYPIQGGSLQWFKINGGASITGYSNFAAYSGETGGITANPLLTAPTAAPPAVSPVCTTIPSTGPAPCPSGWTFSTVSSPAVGTGFRVDQAPWNLPLGDYYGNTCPTSHGTGVNIGAAACQFP